MHRQQIILHYNYYILSYDKFINFLNKYHKNHTNFDS